MKAIIKCHWKSYLVLGIFILLEVKAFISCALFFFFFFFLTIFRSVLRWTGPVGREVSSLRSEDKMSRNHDVAQQLCLSLEWTDA